MTREALSEGGYQEILGADPRRLADAMFRMFRAPSRFDCPLFRKRYPLLNPRYFDDPGPCERAGRRCPQEHITTPASPT